MKNTNTKSAGQNIRDTIYSVGVDRQQSSREKIIKIHGEDSEVTNALRELDVFLNTPDPAQFNAAMTLRRQAEDILPQSSNKNNTAKAKAMLNRSHKLLAFENRPDVRKFAYTVRRLIKTPGMCTDVAMAMVNAGYIEALNRLSANSAPKIVAFAKDYAQSRQTSTPQALLFGYGGSARYALIDWIVNEKTHGMHRPGRQPHPLWSEETKKAWQKANNTCSLPVAVDDTGENVAYDITVDGIRLPQGAVNKSQHLWRCNPALLNYTGTNRLSGDTPYRIIEDVMDMMIRTNLVSLSRNCRNKYDNIVEDANKKGIDSFLMVYRNLFKNPDRLKPYWDEARQWLYDQSLMLWENQSKAWLAKGKRKSANGAVYKPAKTNKKSVPKKKIPGTIYLNNGRYYWVVARKMPPKPLIDPKSKPKVPGTIFKNGNRYYWFIPNLLKRQRLVPDGEKFSAKDRTIAEKIALRKWKKLQKDDPAHAAKILRHTRSRGLATKDKVLAEKIAMKMWKDIRKNNPELAQKILTDNRPRAKDHWHAQIKTGSEVRFIGSFVTKAEAQAAYRKEFEKLYGYPAGYNVQCIPKLDKVWPVWSEQKARLALMDDRMQLPVIGKTDEIKPLEPLIQKMRRVGWIAEHCILVFDDNSPAASQAVATVSRGSKWYEKIRKQGRRTVIQGSLSIDKDTGRIKITIFRPAFRDKKVLAEEIFHIIYRIIRKTNSVIYERIQRWHSGKMKNGFDLNPDEAFALVMARDTVSRGSSEMPSSVFKYAGKLFSEKAFVPGSVIHEIKAGV